LSIAIHVEGAVMQNNQEEGSTEIAPFLLAWAASTESQESLLEDAGWWVTAGASLLLWTAVALILTTA
jgi:hypothetical protein